MLNFQLMKHHGYSLTDLENMMPFERETYRILLMQYLEEEYRRAKERMNG